MSDESDIAERILKIFKDSSPETVESLIEEAHKELEVSKDILLKQVLELRELDRLVFPNQQASNTIGLGRYLTSIHSIWFWIIIILSIATAISIFAIPEGMYPYAYLRHILGTIYILFLPGYSLIKTFFPGKEIDDIQRVTLSIGTSLALVSIMGLVLYNTPWGIRLIPVTFSLLSLTFILASTGVVREHHQRAQADSIIDNV